MANDNFLYRKVTGVPGEDEMRLTNWTTSPVWPSGDEKTISLMTINLKELRTKANKISEGISENKLAKKLRIKPARLRLWRNTFLGLGGKSDKENQGKSLKLSKEDVFKIMLAVEVIRHGGSRIDATDLFQRISL